MSEKALAFICRICPVCVTARLFPNSNFARKVTEFEKDCPCCNAYKKLYGQKQNTWSLPRE